MAPKDHLGVAICAIFAATIVLHVVAYVIPAPTPTVENVRLPKPTSTGEPTLVSGGSKNVLTARTTEKSIEPPTVSGIATTLTRCGWPTYGSMG